MITLIIYSVLIAVFSVCYKLILSYEPVLNWWFQFGLKFHQRWFYKPVWGCEKCFAGQLAAWTYGLNWFAVILSTNSVSRRLLFKVVPNYEQTDFSLLNGLFFITASVLFTNALAALYLKQIKNNI